jgi:hypothetical protein
MLPISIRHIEDFRTSGLNGETLGSHKVWSVDQSESERLLGFRPKSGGWAIEYPRTNGTGPAFVRIKPDLPFIDENAAKYLTVKGASNRLFIPTFYGDRELVFGKSQSIIHHHGQPQKDSTRDNFQLMRGSSVIGTAGDSYLTLTRHSKQESPTTSGFPSISAMLPVPMI